MQSSSACSPASSSLLLLASASLTSQPTISAEMATMKYVYEDLPGEDFIRLLFVQPTQSFEEDIQCTLSAFPLSGKPEYTALSYSWGMDVDGDASLWRRIIINGRQLRITQNLYECLQQMCTTHKWTTPFWIDAVCINQGNVEERNVQVARMGAIYADAREVISWIGNGSSPAEDEEIATIIGCLSARRHLHFREHWIASDSGRRLCVCLASAALSASDVYLEKSAWNTDFPLPECIRNLFDRRDVADTLMHAQECMIVLSRRRYWRRRWIIQEVCLARSVVIAWAGNLVRADVLYQLYRNLERHMISFTWSPQDLGKLGGLLGLRSGYPTTAADSFFMSVVLNGEDSFCSDPRDQVYSILSLDPATTVRPNYNLGVADVYIAFWVDILHRRHLVSSVVLGAAHSNECDGTERDEIAKSLPSWCPDIRKESTRKYFMFMPPRELGERSERDWNVDVSGTLTCVSYVHGFLSDDLATVRCANSSSAADSKTQEVHRHNFHPAIWLREATKRKCLPGDLVCSFDARRRDPAMPSALIIRPVEHETDTFNLVGPMYFEADNWWMPEVCFERMIRLR